jgi:hypothetical protein
MIGTVLLARRHLMLLLVISPLGACASLIADYSLDAYKNATSLKAETAALIDKSAEQFTAHKADVDALTTKINAAYEFSAGLPSNQISAQQWEILRNPNGNLYGGFINRWKQSGSLSTSYRTEKKMQLGRAFDYIICLEANKKESTPCPVADSATTANANAKTSAKGAGS